MLDNKIGIIGGLSPESTISYYRHIVDMYNNQYKDLTHPEIIIYSVDMAKYHKWRDNGRWDKIINELTIISNKLESAGAAFGLIATNSMHMVYEEVQQKTKLKLIHIADATATAIKNKKITDVGLLGTKFTMSENFYLDRLKKEGINVLLPSFEDQDYIHHSIFNELIYGKIKVETRQKYREIVEKLSKNGAKGIILGCTEIPLLLRQEEFDIILFDTAKIHAHAVLLSALESNML